VYSFGLDPLVLSHKDHVDFVNHDFGTVFKLNFLRLCLGVISSNETVLLGPSGTQKPYSFPRDASDLGVVLGQVEPVLGRT